MPDEVPPLVPPLDVAPLVPPDVPPDEEEEEAAPDDPLPFGSSLHPVMERTDRTRTLGPARIPKS